MNRSTRDDWPALDWAFWSDTASTLHLWTRIVGKIRSVHVFWGSFDPAAYYSSVYPSPPGY